MRVWSEDSLIRLVDDQFELLLDQLKPSIKLRTLVDTALPAEKGYSAKLRKYVLKFVWKRFSADFASAQKATKIIAASKWSTVFVGKAVVYALNGWLMKVPQQSLTLQMLGEVFRLFGVFSTSGTGTSTGRVELSTVNCSCQLTGSTIFDQLYGQFE